MPMTKTRALIKLCRPYQWTKNLLVFAGVVFGQKFENTNDLESAALVFVGFCLLSSGLYIFNDILDVEQDRRSEKKRTRPIAAGVISKPAALLFCLLFSLSGLVICALRGMPTLSTALSYATVSLLYSIWLKHLVLLDVLAIATGFVLRAVAGAVAIPVPISPWLLICSLLLALFLALGKRRQELVLVSEAANHRPVLAHYTQDLLDQIITIVASATLVAYCVYTADTETVTKFHTQLLPLTIPFVMYGLFRYLYLVHKHDVGEDPSATLLADVPLLLDILLWGLACVAIILLSR